MLCREDLIYFGAMMLLSNAMVSNKENIPSEEDCVKKAEEMFDLIFNKDE